ncbi:MAG: hypothetical protein Fues2KO_18410 [Fuerstiella sp.]
MNGLALRSLTVVGPGYPVISFPLVVDRVHMPDIAHRSQISFRYHDPLELVWIKAAERMGMRIERSDRVYAAWDGCGTLTVGTPETLDPDDCLAQMILHEVCHALVEGADAFHLPDWGIDILNPAHRSREFSCLHLQAAITQPFGLKQMLGATTSFRAYYDQLPADPLSDATDPIVVRAQAGFGLMQSNGWQPVLHQALSATAAIAAIVAPDASADSLWSTAEVPN